MKKLFGWLITILAIVGVGLAMFGPTPWDFYGMVFTLPALAVLKGIQYIFRWRIYGLGDNGQFSGPRALRNTTMMDDIKREIRKK